MKLVNGIYLILTIFVGSNLGGSTIEPVVSYTALSDAAREAGKLRQYENVPVTECTIKAGKYVLNVSVPKSARAYDVIPVYYKFAVPGEWSQADNGRWAAVEAVAFEDTKKAGDKSFYDMAIPGNLKVNIEYLGSIGANYNPSVWINQSILPRPVPKAAFKIPVSDKA